MLVSSTTKSMSVVQTMKKKYPCRTHFLTHTLHPQHFVRLPLHLLGRKEGKKEDFLVSDHAYARLENKVTQFYQTTCMRKWSNNIIALFELTLKFGHFSFFMQF